MWTTLSTILSRALGLAATPSGRKHRPSCRFVPGLEALEDRRVPAGITNYADVAEMFPRHEGSTILYLNFDGWQDKDVAAYQANSPDDTDPATDERDRNIQEILFRVSEYFSPFDVQVRRIFGDGAHSTSGGNTTIFVGDNPHYAGRGDETGGFVEPRYSDFPGAALGDDHVPNSNPFDIGFVDPQPARGRLDVAFVAQSIAHEAGHTFGLGHVTGQALDPAIPDIMSYGTSHFRFANQMLPLTGENRDGDGDEHVPHWDGQMLQTQNSYAVLRAVLGSRNKDDYASAVHDSAVQNFIKPHALPAVANLSGSVVSARSGTLDRYGDFDVFEYQPARYGETLTIQVKAGAFLGLQSPEVIVFDSQNQFASFHSVAVGTGTLEFSLQMVGTERVRFAVGSRDCDTLGTYVLTTTASLSNRVTDNHVIPVAGVYDTGAAAAGEPEVDPLAFATAPRATPALQGMAAPAVAPASAPSPAQAPPAARAPAALPLPGARRAAASADALAYFLAAEGRDSGW